MKDFRAAMKSARYWIIILLTGAALIWLGVWLGHTDNGSNLNPVSRIIKERVITEKVSTYQKGGVDYLEYLGDEYVLPEDKVIFIGETMQEYEGLSTQKITKSIFFDNDEHEFIYKQEITNRSYIVESTKKRMAMTAAWAYLGALMAWVIGAILILFGIIMFLIWLDDVRWRWSSVSSKKLLISFSGQFFCLHLIIKILFSR